jgi:hypothetical protein
LLDVEVMAAHYIEMTVLVQNAGVSEILIIL